ncbi:hypothetical protein pipiens_014864, partial [Culex pipiens pipiens]
NRRKLVTGAATEDDHGVPKLTRNFGETECYAKAI